MLGCHATSTLFLRLVPTIAPDMVHAYGWSQSFIGWLATAANAGSLVLVAVGTGVFRLMGSLRSIRWGLAAGGFGTLLLLVPLPAVALVGCIVAGLGHAPTNPAGNDVLQRHVPRGKQGLIFSIKQSSIPIAGIVGGLMLPRIAEIGGVQAAIVVAALFGALMLLVLRPLDRHEPAPEAGRSLGRAFSLENITAPMRVVLVSTQIRSLAISGLLLGFVQTTWFVYMTSILAFALGYSATEAGGLFALMQAASIAGRLMLGWGADRMHGGLGLIAASIVGSVLSTLALALAVASGPGWWVVVACFAGGAFAAGWNGIQMAEAVRLAPEGKLYESVSGVTLGIGGGVVSGPLIVSVLLGLGVNWVAILTGIALLPLLSLPSVLRELRRDRA